MHSSLINAMNALGYGMDEKGICHGIAMMGIQACITNNVSQFNERLRFIEMHHPDQLVLKLSHLNENISGGKQTYHRTDEDQRLIDVLAFLDGVKLYQAPQLNAEYFEKNLSQNNAADIAKVTSSIQLEQQGNLQNVKSFVGIYKDAELLDYQQLLHRIANVSQDSFSLSINSPSHAVALHYDHKSNHWLMIDANQLPIEAKQIDIAAWLKTALSEKSDTTVFQTKVYLPGDALSTAKKLNNFFDHNDGFAELHTVTPERATYKNHLQLGLDVMAAMADQADVIEKLASLNVDLNQISGDKYLIYWALFSGSNHAFRALVDAQVDLTKEFLEASAAEWAAARGNSEVLEMLWQHGINIAEPHLSNDLALLAIKSNSPEIIAMLHRAGADLDMADKRGNTLLIKAIKEKNADCVRELVTAGADVNKANNRGITALDYAKFTENQDILKQVLSATDRQRAEPAEIDDHAYKRRLR